MLLLLLLRLVEIGGRVHDTAEMFSLYSSSNRDICFSLLEPDVFVLEATVLPPYDPSTSKLPGNTPFKKSKMPGASLSIITIIVFSGTLQDKTEDGRDVIYDSSIDGV